MTASSCSTNSPEHIGGYLLATGDSAKWPKGFNTASDPMWANNYIRWREKMSEIFHSEQKGVSNKQNIENANLIVNNSNDANNK